VGNTSCDPVKGFLYSLGGVILLSTNFITVKYALRGFDPETFSLVWTSAAAIYAFGITLVGRESREQIFPQQAMKGMIGIGTCTALGMILAWKGLSKLDTAFASFLWRFLPVLTILSGVLVLKERLSKKELLAMTIMLLGGLSSVVGRWDTVGSGVTLTILACLAGVGQLLIAKLYVHKVHPNVLVAYRVGIGSILIACWIFATGAANFTVEVRYWYVTLLGAFLGPCASFLFTFRAYRYWTLSQSSLILTAQPLLVLPMAYVFLGTAPTRRELVGGCIILSGAFWFALMQVTKARKHRLDNTKNLA
jgi:drug/metabolite transporter (DMT)-like permease